MRFVSVMTRDVSSAGLFVEAEAGAVIPLYRLVHVQLERQGVHVEGVPEWLRTGRVLSAVWRVGPCRAATGTPTGYALRFLVEPHQNACVSHAPPRMAVAS